MNQSGVGHTVRDSGKRTWLYVVAAAVLVSVLALAALLYAPERIAETTMPNVLLITADDMSWNSLGVTGNDLDGISPNLDQLASEGFLIENVHIATPICGPSRHALYTGQYPHRSGYMGHGKQPPQWWKAEERVVSERSIASLLNERGYLTGVVGKHGSDWCEFSASTFSQDSDTGRRTTIDTEQGLGLGRDPAKYYAFVRDFFASAKKEGRPFYLAANAHDPHRYWARHRDETIEWINAMMGSSSWEPLDNGKPYPDPKTQFDPAGIPMPPSYPDDRRLREDLAKYYDSVNRMDEVVGEVLRALDESGLADNTIVMFLSDHGLAWDLAKWTLYPLGTKTPLIVRWPGKINPGQRNEESVVSAVDIAPTLAEMCGLEPMEKIDGMSFLDLLYGDVSDWTRTEAFTSFNYLNNEIEFDERYQSYTPDLYKNVDQYRPSRALSSTRFTYIWNGWSDGKTTLPNTMGVELRNLLREYADDPEDKTYPDYRQRVHFMEKRAPEELCDTVTDPGCLTNLANDPEYETMITGFRTRLEQLMIDTGDHELANYRVFLRLMANDYASTE